MLFIVLGLNLLLALLCLTLTLGLLKLYRVLPDWSACLTLKAQDLRTELSTLQVTLSQQTHTLEAIQSRLTRLQQQWRLLQQWLTLLSLLQGIWGLWRRQSQRLSPPR
ncbi:hypothetical protein GS597_17015 [Synechococcales cyanobacterium C]|uniref:Uncharacterized protein n=1 Tax=Petrachloros mirabilis ULC683 TaxID=2781853 RepID=A0A8K2A0E8_9CYAN|nr:hypothetical protein [Petrachloros mirabilis]NCJ08178.1 hypothetical protein [Petrachloros mirabilis ULC683]